MKYSYFIQKLGKGLIPFLVLGFYTNSLAQAVGIGSTQFVPLNTLDVKGAMVVGSYAGVNTAPSNGLLVSGNLNIGTAGSYPYSINILTNGTKNGQNYFGFYNNSGTRLTRYTQSGAGQIFILANGGMVDDAGTNFTVFRFGSDANRIFFGAYGTAGAVLSGNSYIISTHNIYFTVNGIPKTTSATPVMVLDGNTKFVGLGTTTPTSKLDIYTPNGYDQLRIETRYTPCNPCACSSTNTSICPTITVLVENSADTKGNIGDTAWDPNYFYIKTSTGWKRMAFSSF